MFSPDDWHDFFLMVGGGTAALAGLVFVALSINLSSIAHEPTHRFRAIGTLSGYVGSFAICALALMGGQGAVPIAVEWMLVAAFAGAIYVYGYVQAWRSNHSSAHPTASRTVFGTTCYLAQVAGTAAAAFGQELGIYVAAAGMVILVAYLTTGAWLLVVGVERTDNT